MSLDIENDDLLRMYAQITPAPVLDDTDLEAWGELYQCEPALRAAYYFDLFASSPISACLAVGVAPRPHDNGALPIEPGRRLLREQRYVAARSN